MSSKALRWGACALVICSAAGLDPATATAEDLRPPSGAAAATPPATPPQDPAPASTASPAAPQAPAASAPVVHLEETVVRIPRGQAAGDPAGAATVVEASRFAGEAKDVAQLVATAPGVAVADYGGLGQLTTVSIRGSTSDGVLVLLDGLPLNTAFGGSVDLSSIPSGWIERVEVLRGPEGAYFGAGALGGVVNVVTRPARAGQWAAQVAGGSFQTGSASAEGALALGGGSLLLSAGGQATGGRFPFQFDVPGEGPAPRQRGNDQAWRAGTLAKLFAPLEAGDLDGLLEVSAGRRGLPGPASAPTPLDWQEDGRILAMARLSRPGPGATRLAYRLHARADWLDVRISDPIPIRQRGAGAGLSAALAWDHGPGRLTAEATGAFDLAQARGLGADRSRGSGSLSLAEDLLLAGGRIRVAPAARADLQDRFPGLSGKAGASARLADLLTARASVGRAIRVPSLAELHFQQGLVIPNPSLTPESNLSGEAALVADGALGLASVGAHLTRYQDLILYQPTSLGRLKPSNSGQALTGGLEVEAATAPLLGPARASVAGAYTLLQSRLLSGSPAEVGRQIPYRARHRLFARVAGEPGPVELHVEAHYVGRRFQDRRNLEPIAATLLWNAGAALRLMRDPLLRLHLEVQNLLDDRTLTDGLGNPLPSRMVMLTLRGGSTPTPGAP